MPSGLQRAACVEVSGPALVQPTTVPLSSMSVPRPPESPGGRSSGRTSPAGVQTTGTGRCPGAPEAPETVPSSLTAVGWVSKPGSIPGSSVNSPFR